MNKLLAAMAISSVAALAVPGVAAAAPGDAECRKGWTDLYIELVGTEGTRGEAISDGWYGNEPNEVDGKTVPSQSPGPKKTLPDGSVVIGSTWGDFQQTLRALCSA